MRRQTDELALLVEAGQLIGQSLDIDAVYSSFQRMVARYMDTDGMVVSEYTPEDDRIRTTFLWSDDRKLDPSSIPVLTLNTTGGGLQSRVIRTGITRPCRTPRPAAAISPTARVRYRRRSPPTPPRFARCC